MRKPLASGVMHIHNTIKSRFNKFIFWGMSCNTQNILLNWFNGLVLIIFLQMQWSWMILENVYIMIVSSSGCLIGDNLSMVNGLEPIGYYTTTVQQQHRSMVTYSATGSEFVATNIILVCDANFILFISFALIRLLNHIYIYNRYVAYKFKFVHVCPDRIAKFMGPTWGPPGSCRPQMGPMLAPWNLLSGWALKDYSVYVPSQWETTLWHKTSSWAPEWSLAVVYRFPHTKFNTDLPSQLKFCDHIRQHCIYSIIWA